MLTRKQHELLLFINERLSRGGVSPSFDEMKEALGLKSKSGIHRLITGLEERGFIRRLAATCRARARPCRSRRSASSTPVIRGNFSGALPGAPVGDASESVQLPLYGRIAAGTPIEALRDSTNSIPVPAFLLKKGDHYALEVDGDSMIGAGILDGDTVIIERCDTAENGAVIVALVDANEVTLKRLRRKGDSVALEPANPAYETRIFGPDRVRVQGRLVGLLRRY